jgi:histidinol-phosphate aminotransferase
MLYLDKIVRKNIKDLIPYSSARDEYKRDEAIFLDANENPYGEGYNRYPDPQQLDLKERISQLKGVDVPEIFLGNGSDEAIDLLFRVFCEPGRDNVIIPDPTYGMYAVCADINDVEIRNVSLTPDFQLDLEAILKAVDENTKMIFVCSPNNPTSNSFPADDIMHLIQSFTHGLVVLDEAYIDFASQESLLKYITNYQNLVVLQTFSKAWGMAGIRLGMAMAYPPIIQLMSKVKYPYNINQLTQDLALDALSDVSKMNTWVKDILDERTMLQQRLPAFSFAQKIYPTDCNFLMLKVDDPVGLYTYLTERKVIVRNRSKVNLCDGCLRFTVGTREENARLLEELKEYEESLNTQA